MIHSPRFFFAVVAGLLALAEPASALNINGLTANANNRWANTPADPLGTFTPNTNAAFVGLAYDFSGVGWKSTNTGSWNDLSVTLISPLHMATAYHVGDRFSNNTFTFQNTDGALVSRSITGTYVGSDIGFTDARVVKLDRPFKTTDKVNFYRLLDAGPLANVLGKPSIVYGKSGSGLFDRRVGISTVYYVNDEYFEIQFDYTSTATNYATAYVTGDSSSPSFMVHNGQLHFAGAHHYSQLSDEAWSSTPIDPGVNTFMAIDGYALRWTIDPAYARTWTGTTNGTFATTTNWTSGNLPGPTYSAAFEGSSTGNRTVTLGEPATVRGLLVKAASGTNPFTLTGSTLTVMESGLRNEDADTLTINFPISLGGSQNWEAATGPITLGGNIATAGFLAVLSGDQTITLGSGVVFSGTGSVSWDNPGTWTPPSGQLGYSGKLFVRRGTVNLTTANAYAAGTVVTGGTLLANNPTGSATGAGSILLSNGGSLGGTGTVSGTVTLQTNGALSANLTTVAASHDKLDITGVLALGTTGTLAVTGNVNAAPGTYTLITAAGGITGTVPTLSLPADWAATVQISGNNLTLIVTATVAVTPAITSGQSTTGTPVGSFSYQIAAINGPTSYALASGSLPPGITLNTATGLLTGTPYATGTFTPSFTATNSPGTSPAVAMTITINANTITANGLVLGNKSIGAIWCIGDSITQSNADGDGNSSPRKSLYDLLLANGYTFSSTGHSTSNTDGLPSDTNYTSHSGISGSLIGTDVSGRIGHTQNDPSYWSLAGSRILTVKPKVVLIMLGTNDVDFLTAELAAAPSRLTTLINTLYALPGFGNPTVFVASIAPNRSSPQDPANTATFNAAVPGVVNAQAALGRDVRFVDHFTPLDNGYATYMMADNLHPNTAGNGVIAQQWFNAIHAIAGVATATPVITSGQSSTGSVGVGFNYQINVRQSPTSYALASGSLPPGVSLNTSTGQASSLATPNAAVLIANGTAGLPLVGVGTGPDAGKLQLTYIRRKAATYPGITYAVEFSDTLSLWAVNAAATQTATSIDAVFERVTITDSVASPAKRFVRVRVTST